MLYVTGCSDSHLSRLGGAVVRGPVQAFAQLPISWRRSAYLGGTNHGVEVFPTGSRVRVTNYSPFRGLRGTIRAVNMIDVDLEEPFCFYLVALEGVQMKEPIWFEYNEVELVAPPHVSQAK